MHDEARRRIEALLTPQQLADLKEADFRRDASIYLGDPEVQKKIGLDDKQKAGVLQARWDASSEIARFTRENHRKVFAVLTPQQQEKLREAVERGGW